MSKEQIIKNKLKSINSPKNFMAGKVTDSIFTDFNKKPVEDDEEEWKKIQIQKYQIIPKWVPVKALNKLHNSDDYDDHQYVSMRDRVKPQKPKESKPSRSNKYMTPQRK